MAEPAPHRPPDNTVRVALKGVYATRPWVNRFWLKITETGEPTAADLLALSNAVALAFRTRFGPQCTTQWTSQTQRAVWYKSDGTEVGVDGADTGSGALAGPGEPAQVCYLINWAIGATYRGGHPRTYLSGCNSPNIGADGTVDTTRRPLLSTAAANFLSDVNSLTGAHFATVQLGTVAFFRGNSALNPPVFEPYIGGSCNGKVATQRRRLQRG